MKRRQYVVGLGALASGSAAALGTGAFSSVEADRSVTVDTARDSQAFLGLENSENEDNLRAYPQEGKIEFSIPGKDDDAEGNGVGGDSVYRFEDLLEIFNQGTQPVEIRSRYEGNALNDIALTKDGEELNEDPPLLEPGDRLHKVGLLIDSTGSETGSYDETLTIIAEAPDG